MKWWLVCAVIALLAAQPAAGQEELDAVFAKDVLVIEASALGCYRFDVYLAISREQQMRGLMFVREMSSTTGMLFLYDTEAFHSMWMKNTYLSLDIVFAHRDGTVSSVAANTEPLSLRSVASIEPVAFVLELNAGTATKLFIDEDSRLIWEPAHGDVE